MSRAVRSSYVIRESEEPLQLVLPDGIVIITSTGSTEDDEAIVARLRALAARITQSAR